MLDLRRVELFGWILSMDNGAIDNAVVREAMINLLGVYRNVFIEEVKLNFEILSGIESYFVPKESSTSSELSLNEFKSIFDQNVENNGIEEQLGSFSIEILNCINSYYAFNKLINRLNKASNKILQDFQIATENGNFEPNPEQRFPNRVFLSYAYKDRLYTLCLYFYMLAHDVDLYVDWLFCPQYEDGKKIKANLSHELKKANQFLFLRSTNSELRIGGNNSIRGWCSWEMGAYYNLNIKSLSDKFYIELYARDIDEKAFSESLQLDGLTRLTSVYNGKLQG